MKYLQVIFDIHPMHDDSRDILIALLSEIGYDSFQETDDGVDAYIPENIYSREKVEEMIAGIETDSSILFVASYAPDINWNEEWEKNFQPVLIDGKCFIKASFHKAKEEYPYIIEIDPKMAFGTGHHESTSLMVRNILQQDFNGKSVLDMGCGTGILAILAEKRGAASVLAIDNDPLAIKSCNENIATNNAKKIQAVEGDFSKLVGKSFDIVLANITRNILLENMPEIGKVLNPGGKMILSGFYEEDLDKINDKASSEGFKYESHFESFKWISPVYIKGK